MNEEDDSLEGKGPEGEDELAEETPVIQDNRGVTFGCRWSHGMDKVVRDYIGSFPKNEMNRNKLIRLAVLRVIRDDKAYQDKSDSSNKS